LNAGFLTVIFRTARIHEIIYWRFFSWAGFVNKFFTPVFILGVSWVLFHSVFAGTTGQFACGSACYFTFAAIGNAFYVFVQEASFIVGRGLLWERNIGSIETLFIAPISRLSYMAGLMLATTVNALIGFTAVIGIGFVFGFHPLSFDPLIFTSALILTLFGLFGTGLIINAVTLTFRDRATTPNTLVLLFLTFSGIVAPVSLMPSWAQVLSSALPLTYGLALVRGSMGIGQTDAVVNFALLCLTDFLFVALGVLSLKAIDRNLRRNSEFSVY